MRRLTVLLETPLGRAARYLVSFALLAVFAWSVDWRQLAGASGRFAVGPALLATLIAGITFPLHAWRWQILLRAQGVTPAWRWTHAVTWIGQFYNAFLLGGLGGDAARVFYLCRDEPTRKTAGLAAIFLDRLMGLVVLLSLAAVALVAKLDAVAQHTELRTLLIASLAVIVATVASGIVLFRRSPQRLARWIGEERAIAVADILHRTGTARRALLAALVASYVIWLLDFVSIWLLAESVGLPLPFLEVCLAMSVAYAASALPVSIGGHGVREGALLAMLAIFKLLPDATAEQRALLLALLAWGVTVVWSLAGGLVLLLAPVASQAPHEKIP